MWDHREYLVKQAMFRADMAKEAGLLDLIGKGVKGVAQIGQGAIGMAKELPGAVKSFGSEIGNAAKGALPASQMAAAPKTALQLMQEQNAARMAARAAKNVIPPKPPGM